VIKVEPPSGEPNRHIGVHQAGCSVFFRNTHRGKKSIVLNLKDPRGQEALLKLTDTADVLVEAFRPGVVDRLGVGYQAVSARNPRIVYCAISAFGQMGPYAQKPAHDLSIEALSGALSVNLGNDGAPTNPGIPAADMAGSMLALAGVLMALYRREQTGRGDYLDMSMQDALLSFTANALGPTFGEKRAPIPKEERTWGGASFYRVYQTADGRYLTLGGRELKFVGNFLKAWDRMDLMACCEGEPGPVEAPVVAFLTELFASKTLAEWESWFADRDICWAPVKNLREAFDDPHVQARHMRLNETADIEHVGSPFKFQQEPGQVHFAVPGLGEHTAELLGLVGYSPAELSAMSREGVFGELEL
jgi:crotonobetainyl-CoA:carnitine CoA-transferase CaiB-like acyl-CoA transferase